MRSISRPALHQAIVDALYLEDSTLAERFTSLAVFADGAPVPLEALRGLWGDAEEPCDEADARETVERLVADHLIQRVHTPARRTEQSHALAHASARAPRMHAGRGLGGYGGRGAGRSPSHRARSGSPPPRDGAPPPSTSPSTTVRSSSSLTSTATALTSTTTASSSSLSSLSSALPSTSRSGASFSSVSSSFRYAGDEDTIGLSPPIAMYLCCRARGKLPDLHARLLGRLRVTFIDASQPYWTSHALLHSLAGGGRRLLPGSLASVCCVDASGHCLGSEGVAVLASALVMGTLPSLTSLVLDRTGLGDQGLIGLVDAAAAGGALASLTALSLTHNAISEGMALLAARIASGALPRLRALDVSHNLVDTGGIRALAAAVLQGGLAACEDLGLASNRIGDAGIVDLVAALRPPDARRGSPSRAPKLRLLRLSGNPIGDVALSALAQGCADGFLSAEQLTLSAPMRHQLHQLVGARERRASILPGASSPAVPRRVVGERRHADSVDRAVRC